ncbi:hypothetical protein D4R99_03240 [bacterium]|nr:MAG: hypothetical protein D4R99_03240 [bacterium]
MNCPGCKSSEIFVSGSVKEFVAVNHRYLRCNVCGTIFQTIETIIPESINFQFYMKFGEEDKTVAPSEAREEDHEKK